MSQKFQQLNRPGRHRYRQELVPRRWPQSGWRDRAAAEVVSFPRIISARSGDAIRTELEWQ
jgi:hypothetical protein